MDEWKAAMVRYLHLPPGGPSSLWPIHIKCCRYSHLCPLRPSSFYAEQYNNVLKPVRGLPIISLYVAILSDAANRFNKRKIQVYPFHICTPLLPCVVGAKVAG